MKGTLLTVGGTLALMAGLIALFAWRPWDSKQRERELAWVEALTVWVNGTDTAFERGGATRTVACEARFDAKVGRPPTERLLRAHSFARRSCRGRLRFSEWGIAGRLIEGHRRAAETTYEADLSRISKGISGRRASVHCWADEDWTPLSEQYGLLRGDEFWLAGLADPVKHRIDLAPIVCTPLRRLFRGRYSPRLNFESFELSQALVVLAHEAEHLRVPDAEEDEVECYALQRVRNLVRDTGRSRWYQDEMAGLAWDVGYPNQLEDYRTERCYDGGPLDLHQDSSAWP